MAAGKTATTDGEPYITKKKREKNEPKSNLRIFSLFNFVSFFLFIGGFRFFKDIGGTT